MSEAVLVFGEADWPRAGGVASSSVSGGSVSVGRFDSWSDDARRWFAERLGEATVGWRCVIVGPHLPVAAARASAIAAGAVPEEVDTVVTDDEVRAVYCAGCGHRTVAQDISITCAGCDIRLAVSDHFSPRLTAYLGVP